MEKMKASKKFRAAGSLAQVCIQLYDSVTNSDSNEEGGDGGGINEEIEDDE